MTASASVLTIFSLLTLLFMIVGGIIGYMVNDHRVKALTTYLHPEMYDQNGNLLPDEILAVRFENDFTETEDNSEEEDDQT
tara:strand:- start:303 stop:545 length:243 start_codon:yes stop_codon:yes gene_type:complete